jgi:hypothetical protein
MNSEVGPDLSLQSAVEHYRTLQNTGPKTNDQDENRRYWAKGLLTIKVLADGYFRLRSHKFENWYEQVHRHIDPVMGGNRMLIHTGDRKRDPRMFLAELSVDHGS